MAGVIREDEESAVERVAQAERASSGRPVSDAARKRAAVELIARHEATLRRTARRYSLGAEDAEDSYQRGLEILLTKAPTTDLRELIRWTHTVIKHEALAVRRGRERLLGRRTARAGDEEATDWIALIPAEGDGPAERAERREDIARSREALKTLKPAELRALTLLAEGYSYAEIGELTGWTRTKVNRSLAEGRERFRSVISRSEDGSRCEELRPLLSAFCDGEASAGEVAALREHLRACAGCRATLRAYRAAPRAVAALAPVLPASRSLLERLQEAFAELGSRLTGGSSDAAAQLAASGGAQGAGVAALAKTVALCVGAAGGTAACMATGVLSPPVDLGPDRPQSAAIERSSAEPPAGWGSEAVPYEPAPSPEPRQPPPAPVERSPEEAEAVDPDHPGPASIEPPDAVEYVQPATTPPPPPPASPEPPSSSGSPAGEFGP